MYFLILTFSAISLESLQKLILTLPSVLQIKIKIFGKTQIHVFGLLINLNCANF